MKPILEQIPIKRERSVLAFNYSKRDFDTPWHFHPQHELTYIESSTGTKFIGDFVGPYEAGELVLVRANLPHCWKNRRNEAGKAESTVIQWEKDIFAHVPELGPVFDLLKVASRGLFFEKESVESIIPLVKKLPSLDSHFQYLHLLSVLLQLSTCPYKTLSSSSFINDLPTEYNSRMAKIHDFVGVHYKRKIYLKELAELVNLSEQSFSRFFSKMMGRPFFTFLNEYRINIANRMLLDTDWSVAEISYACGYESLPFFHKQFNKFNTETPSAYRKKYGQKR